METDVTASLYMKGRKIPAALPLEGIRNARELGAYPAAGGAKRVKRGLFYRSGELYGGTEGDMRFLEELGIKTVVDFRSEEEKRASPETMPGSVKQLVELPIDAGNLMGTVYTAEAGWSYASTAAGAVADMKKLYTALPEEAIPRYRVLFSLLAAPENTPLLFHCTAGKDRTGLAAALLLYSLGVDRAAILEDYLYSAECLQRWYGQFTETKPHLVPYWTVQESYIETAFVKIEDYGGLDTYITGELGADIGRLRSLYTG